MERKIIASNKRAAHRYEIIEKIEAGIELRGTEVKSLRQNKVDLKDSFGRIQGQEVFRAVLSGEHKDNKGADKRVILQGCIGYTGS